VILARANLFQHRPQRVDESGNPEKNAQHQVDQRGFDVARFEINRQRRDEDREDDQNNFAHARRVKPPGNSGNKENYFGSFSLNLHIKS
jgi:hypothetical protein